MCYTVLEVINLIPVQFKKGVLKLCVLSLLADRECYGYQLVQEISVSVEISEGTIYPLLQRLRKQKLVETYLKESNEGPPRKYYKLTDEGISEYKVLKDGWKIFSKKVNQLLERGEMND